MWHGAHYFGTDARHHRVEEVRYESCALFPINTNIIRYWHPDFPGSDKYSLINAAVAAGYSVLSYDRIGVGSSSKYVSVLSGDKD
jgi:hypothetical protein